MRSEQLEAMRRATLAAEYVKKNPPKFGFKKGGIQQQIINAYLHGYLQCTTDLLTPRNEPGVPASAVTLLNRVGEMVLRNRKELLTIHPRIQCPGCFCILEEVDKKFGWCARCFPHQEKLIAQTVAPEQG